MSHRPLKILYVNGTSAGGSLMSTTQLARRLAERGHTITLLHERKGGSVTRYVYRRATNLEVKRRGRPGGRWLTRVNRHLGAVRRSHLQQGVEVQACLISENGARSLLDDRPDVVVLSSISRVGWRRVRDDAARRRLPTVLYLREEALLAHLEIVGRPDLLVANSHALGVAAGADQPVLIVPSVVELEAAAVASERRVALLINPVSDYGLETASDLAAANPDIPFVFQESTPLSEAETASARAIASRHPNVEFRGFNPSPAEVYRDAKVLLAPYAGTLRSNRPRSVLEAMSNGIPVLARDRPGLREAVGSGGIFVPEESGPEEWSRELRRLWTDPVLYQELRQGATVQCRAAVAAMEAGVACFEAALRRLVESWGGHERKR